MSVVSVTPVPGYEPELLYTYDSLSGPPVGICAVPNLEQASEDVLSTVNSTADVTIVSNPGQGLEAPSTGQPITKTGRTIHGQIPGTSVVVNLPR